MDYGSKDTEMSRYYIYIGYGFTKLYIDSEEKNIKLCIESIEGEVDISEFLDWSPVFYKLKGDVSGSWYCSERLDSF